MSLRRLLFMFVGTVFITVVVSSCHSYNDVEEIVDTVESPEPSAKSPGLSMGIPGETFLNEEEISITFLEEQEIGEELFLAKPAKKYDGHIVWWGELHNVRTFKEFKENYDIVVPEVDLEGSSVVFSLGRKIVRMRYFFSEHYGYGTPVGIVTFEEGFYENTVFFYSVERIEPGEYTVFVPSGLMSPCFIMEGRREKYLGLFLFN